MWEFKEGICHECGEYGTWLEFAEAKGMPEKWFAIHHAPDGQRLLLCSIRCVERWQERARVRDLASRESPRESNPSGKTSGS
jgi:hypothetical protein